MGSPHKVLVLQKFEICFVINVNKPLYKSRIASYLRGPHFLPYVPRQSTKIWC